MQPRRKGQWPASLVCISKQKEYLIADSTKVAAIGGDFPGGGALQKKLSRGVQPALKALRQKSVIKHSILYFRADPVINTLFKTCLIISSLV